MRRFALTACFILLAVIAGCSNPTGPAETAPISASLTTVPPPGARYCVRWKVVQRTYEVFCVRYRRRH